MKFIIFILVLLLLGNPSAYSKEFYPERRSHYVGFIGSMPIQLELTGCDEKIQGTLLHETTGCTFSITGTMNNWGMIHAVAKDKTEKPSGSIKISFSESNHIHKGSYYTHSKANSLTLLIEEVAEYKFVSTKSSLMDLHSVYPFFNNQSDLFTTINKNIQDAMIEYHNDYRKEAEEYAPEFSEFGTWTLYHDLSISYYSDELISLLANIYTYSGGAHGNTGYISQNFMVISNKRLLIKLEDLFVEKSEYMQIISSYCIEQLKKQEAGWVVDGELTSLSKSDLDIFTLNSRSITFYFAPYHVGCYAEGTHIVTIPYYILKKVIDPEGPLKTFYRRL